MDIKTATEKAKQIKDNINKVIIGKSKVIDLILTALLAKGHVLLEDVPGTGKTVMAKSLAKSLEADFARIQFTPDLLPSDVTGINYYNQNEGKFIFRQGPVFCNILLADEINRATPRTQSSLLECMEERQITVDGVTRKLDEAFFVIATQNPVETAGTFPLPEAQLDRFLMKISMGFPTVEEEIEIMDRFMLESPLEKIESVCDRQLLNDLQKCAKTVYVHAEIQRYIANIVEKTRESKQAALGVSPRGTLAMLNAVRAYAMLDGRDFANPDDVKALAVPVLAHRIILKSEAKGIATSKAVIEGILTETKTPTEEWARNKQ